MMLEVRQEAGSEDGTPLEVWQEIGNEAGGQEQNLVAGVQDQRGWRTRHGAGDTAAGLEAVLLPKCSDPQRKCSEKLTLKTLTEI